MLKKMTPLAISVGALIAFAAPVAQGQELYELSGTTHVPLKVGVEVTATSVNMEAHTPLGTIKCAKVTIHGKVTKNEATTAHFGTNSVTVEGGNTAITSQAVGTITILANTTGQMDTATFKAFGCHYTGNVPFSYAHDTSVLTVTGNALGGTPNPPCGDAKMTGNFTLETSNGVTILME